MALGFGTDEATAKAYVRDDVGSCSFNMTKAEVDELSALQSPAER